jgi:hypothetical protein
VILLYFDEIKIKQNHQHPLSFHELASCANQ